jgi:hypothetical protein
MSRDKNIFRDFRISQEQILGLVPIQRANSCIHVYLLVLYQSRMSEAGLDVTRGNRELIRKQGTHGSYVTQLRQQVNSY